MEVATPKRNALGAIALALVVGAAAMLLPFTVPLILAAWAAELTRGLVARVERVVHSRRVAAALVVLLLLAAIAGPLAWAIAALVSGAADLVDELQRAFGGGSRDAHLRPSRLITPNAGEWLDLIRRHGASSYRVLVGAMHGSARFAIAIVVFLAGVQAFAAHGESIRRWLRGALPVPGEAFDRLAGAFTETGRGLLVGMGGTALAQGVVATITYAALGVPHAALLGFLTATAAIVPSIGTAIVWVPTAGALALLGHPVRAIILAAVGLAVISTIDNVLRPILTRHGRLDLPTLVVFLSMLGGVLTLGGAGVVLGPLLVRMAVEAIALARERGLLPAGSP